MFYDTETSPPTYVVIGIVHGGSICGGFYKSLIFPEIFVRTEDSEVLKFIRDIISKYQVRRIKRRAGTVKLKPQIVVLILNNDSGNNSPETCFCINLVMIYYVYIF